MLTRAKMDTGSRKEAYAASGHINGYGSDRGSAHGCTRRVYIRQYGLERCLLLPHGGSGGYGHPAAVHVERTWNKLSNIAKSSADPCRGYTELGRGRLPYR